MMHKCTHSVEYFSLSRDTLLRERLPLSDFGKINSEVYLRKHLPQKLAFRFPVTLNYDMHFSERRVITSTYHLKWSNLLQNRMGHENPLLVFRLGSRIDTGQTGIFKCKGLLHLRVQNCRQKELEGSTNYGISNGNVRAHSSHWFQKYNPIFDATPTRVSNSTCSPPERRQ